MLIDLFLAPGRYLCRRLPSNRRRSRYQARNVIRGPVLLASLLGWGLLAGLAAVLVLKLASPPVPEAKPTLISSAEAGVGKTAPVGPGLSSAPADPAAPRMAPAAASAASGGADSMLEAGSALTRTLEKPPAAIESAGAQVWLVIVESIPKRARTEAERSLARHKRKGLDLELLDTDAYPMLKGGMWTLAMGPFDTKLDADKAAADLKPKVRDLMVRRGL